MFTAGGSVWWYVQIWSQRLKSVSPGNASSTLVRLTQSNGSMYRYWSGDRAKTTKTRDWVVTCRAAEIR
jgi:hypothetical protein